MRKHQNVDWILPDDGPIISWDVAKMSVLMDIRDALRVIDHNTSALQCSNARQIPVLLRRIEKHLRPKKLTHRQIVRRNQARRRCR